MSQEEYSVFVTAVRKWPNGDAFKCCGCAIPRNEKGWPTIEPDAMSDMQVLYEASRWVSSACETGTHTVSGLMWMKYSNELIRRGLMDTDCQQRYDLLKVLEKGWNDLPPGPIVVDPTILPPVQVDPNKIGLLERTMRAAARVFRRMLPKTTD